MENLFIIKEFFSKTIKSPYLDSRPEHFFIDNNERSNYLFNSSINGIEESDFILLIGSNPRYEATILNARIRKSYLKNNTEIFSMGDLGNLTYPYKILNNSTETIKEIVDEKNEVSEKIKKSKKPIIILGQSVFKLDSANYIIQKLKQYLKKNNKINEKWNAFNVVSNHASTVGSFDLNILSFNSLKVVPYCSNFWQNSQLKIL